MFTTPQQNTEPRRDSLKTVQKVYGCYVVDATY